MKLLKITMIGIICFFSFHFTYANNSLTGKQKIQYGEYVKNVFLNFSKKTSKNTLEKQLQIYEKLSSKIEKILPSIQSEKHKYVFNILNNLVYLEISKVNDIYIKEIEKAQKNSEGIQSTFDYIGDNSNAYHNNLTGALTNSTSIKDRIKLDMLKEFNQLIKNDEYYYDYFSYNDVKEENKIVIDNNNLYSYYQFIKHDDGLYLYIYKGGGTISLKGNSIKPENINNYLYFYNKSSTIQNGNYKYYIYVISKDDYEIVKVNESFTKIPKDLLFQDISWDKYDIETRSKYLKEIDNITQGIISGKNSEHLRIKAIYERIIQNISYDFASYEKTLKGEVIGDVSYAHSGVATYMNKQGVCAGIAKLFVYMLHFAGIENVDYLVGHTFSGNFSFKIGHAWVRVGDFYYDPTWDLYTQDRNRFFRLPRDLMYASRSDKDDPNYSYYSTLSQEQLDKVMEDKYNILIPKYRDQYYYHLEPYILIQEYKNNMGN